MPYVCPAPGCGLDVTERVEEALKETGIGVERVDVDVDQPSEDDQVAVECPNGHTYWYP